MEHTPGPWKAAISEGICATVVTCEQGLICELGGGDCVEPNVRLIAAAPDLLEACKAVVDARMDCSRSHGDFDDTCDYCVAYEQAKTAIAKATS